MTALTIEGRDSVAADRAGFQRHLPTHRRTVNDSKGDHSRPKPERGNGKGVRERAARSIHREQIPDLVAQIRPCGLIQAGLVRDDPRFGRIARGLSIPHVRGVDCLNQCLHFTGNIPACVVRTGRGREKMGGIQMSFVLQKVEPANPRAANPKIKWDVEDPEESNGQQRTRQKPCVVRERRA